MSTSQFDCIIVTATDVHQSAAFLEELRQRQRGGVFPDALIIAVPDPVGARIGSGGATLNALLCGAEALAKKQGAAFFATDKEWLQQQRFLILHSGGDSQRLPICSVRGKAFCSLPALSDHNESDLNAPIGTSSAGSMRVALYVFFFFFFYNALDRRRVICALCIATQTTS
jgi:hypothetical protein